MKVHQTAIFSDPSGRVGIRANQRGDLVVAIGMTILFQIPLTLILVATQNPVTRYFNIETLTQTNLDLLGTLVCILLSSVTIVMIVGNLLGYAWSKFDQKASLLSIEGRVTKRVHIPQTDVYEIQLDRSSRLYVVDKNLYTAAKYKANHRLLRLKYTPKLRLVKYWQIV